MPNFESWVKSQIKRGRKKEEIKRYLHSRGYPLSAITKVNKINDSDKKNLSVNTVLVVAVIIIIIIAGIAYFNLNFTGTSACDAFINDKKSCEQAVKSALQAYPGKIADVEKKEILVPPKTFPGLPKTIEAWIVIVDNNNEANIEVQIDPDTFQIIGVGAV